MHVGGFPSHVVEELRLILQHSECSQFDARAIRGEAAHHPMAVESDSRILDANRSLDELQTADHVGRAVLVPDPSGGSDALGLAGDQSALPGRQRENAGVAEAAETGDAAAQLIRTLWQRQCVLDEATR